MSPNSHSIAGACEKVRLSVFPQKNVERIKAFVEVKENKNENFGSKISTSLALLPPRIFF